LSTRFSPDGMYYWDGAQWMSTLSHDGRFRWDGRSWVPLQGFAYVHGPETRPSRVPTSWTRPLQYAIAVYYALAALYTVTLPFTMSGVVTQAFNQSLQRQQSLYPNATPPPPGFTDAMTSMMNGIFWFAAVVGFGICLVGVIAALRRWTWAYYVILVLLGLGVIGLPVDVIDLFAGSALSGLSGFSAPSWIYVVGIGAGLIDTALFIWMLVALVKRGPWGTSRVAPP
jgi:hypothetical protein